MYGQSSTGVPDVAGETCIAVAHDSDIVTARQRARELAARVGFSGTDQTLVALAISEIARNILSYAVSGTVTLTIVDERGRRGVRIVAKDSGPGIPDVELAMRDGYSTANSLGVGLPGAKRIMDDFELSSVVGRGTTITMTKWLP
jgi:serine/threonine-protein kinase RsbT